MALETTHTVVLLPRVAVLLISVTHFAKCALVDMTIFNRNPILSTSTNADRTFIGGYKGSTAVVGTVSFGRTVVTGTGSGLPTSCSCLLPAIEVRSGNEVFRQYMYCPGDSCSCNGYTDCLYRIGAFYCQIENENHVEKITTINLNEDAVIIPERQTFTVSLGESITFLMTSTLASPAWRWRKTSDTFDDWFDSLAGTHPFQIDQATLSDAGVYECHNAGEREQGVHAIFRLIVRACPRNMWGPPTCQNECPVCYNGGMCHDQMGECICAPGFNGSYCHIANGRNRWGLSNTRLCTKFQDRHGPACRDRLFCLQDPFGCACAAGYKGIACDQECDEPNTFGPYCSQTCHCADGITCLTDTGECNDHTCTDPDDYCTQHCAPGWKGNNCQVPTPCPDGYYGETCNDRCNCGDNQPCNEATGDCFECNCRDDQPCDEVTRECTNGCEDGYIGISCVQDGTRAITTFSQTNKPNAGQPVTVICEVVGNPLPAAGDIILQVPGTPQFPLFTTIESTDLNTYRRTNEYILTGEVASAGTQLTCLLRREDGTFLNEIVTVDVYDPPYIITSPFSISTTETSITVGWDSWTSSYGRGDGPVVRYEVHYRLVRDDEDDTSYDFMESPATSASTSLVVSGLKSRTDYDFVVIVVREGEGGKGPPSPQATIATNCSVLSDPPTSVISTDTRKRSLSFSWERPPCPDKGDIVGYSYRLMDLERDADNITGDTSVPLVEVDDLVPYTLYLFQVLARTTAGNGPYSKPIEISTDEAKPLAPTSVTTTSADTTSITVQWHRPDPPNGVIIAYLVLYQIVQADTRQTANVTEGVDQKILRLQLTGLQVDTSYSIQVQAETRVGRGILSEPVYRMTQAGLPSRPLNVRTVQMDDSCHISWNPPEHTNGTIRSYTVFYIAYPRPGVGLSPEADISNSGSVNVDWSRLSYSFNKSDLAAFSDFRFLVSGRTTAPGMGENSTEAVGACRTKAKAPAKPEPPVVPESIGNPVTQSSFKMKLAQIDQRNGPISCFEITVVRLSNNDVTTDKDPDVLYHPTLLSNHQQAQEAVGIPYVALVLEGHELIKSKDVEIGSGGQSMCGKAGRKRRQTPRDHSGENGALKPDTRYTAFIRAYVQLEDETEAYTSSPLMQPIWTSKAEAGIIVPIMGVLFSVVIAVLIIAAVCALRRRMKRRTENTQATTTNVEMKEIDFDKTLEPQGVTSTVYEDVGLPTWALRWEILWTNLVVDDRVLGRGNFGEVKSGSVNIGGKMTKAAIKILKGRASHTDREDFMEEFRTMTNIGYHPNVVSLLGACQHEDVLYVALEYLPLGDLRSYLRKARLQSDSDEGALSSDRLVKFALDVAKGMEHLAMSGVIHRDLAARNILLGEGLIAKVSDFGLSRGEDIYIQTSMRRVPARWLAIESLTHRTYTTRSDVWSFGILLWEVASIGGTPYPAIMTKALPGRLMEGYRMAKPKKCDDEIYALMLQCWEEDPEKRPTFSDLVTILTRMEDNQEDHIYMAIDRTAYENFSVIRPELDDN